MRTQLKTQNWTKEQLMHCFDLNEEQANELLALASNEEITLWDLNRVAQGNDFAAKVARTVLETGKVSPKQVEILNRSLCFDIESNYNNLGDYDAFIEKHRRAQLPSSMR